MVDVHILYELKNREIENTYLLKLELERRGLSVKIHNIYSPYKYFTRCKLLIVPHLYNDEQLLTFGKNFWLDNNLILSLQYEQILSKAEDKNPQNVHSPKGQAKLAEHAAWGLRQVERYRSCGIKEENIHRIGSISTDFLRQEFDSYFKTRIEIAEEFRLDSNKRWNMFISSFSYANRDQESINNLIKLDPSSFDFIKISNDSYNAIIQWIKVACTKYPDQLFIYRKHPSEDFQQDLKKMQLEYPNFRCISSYSIRQWVRVCDCFLNWYSTSYIDIYLRNKKMLLLRPFKMPNEMDIDIFDGIPLITTIDDFLLALSQPIETPHYKNNNIEKYIDTDTKMAFIKAADLCEFLINRGSNVVFKDWGNRFTLTSAKSPKSILLAAPNLLFFFFCEKFKIKKIPFLKIKKKQLAIMQNDIYDIKELEKEYKNSLIEILKQIHLDK